jgi:hypothetical protein
MKFGSMKRLAFLISCSALFVCATDFANVHTVYLLKMSKGLDQYLAHRITDEHIFQIVTDPKQADAVFTDQIGEGFEARLEEIFPTPEKDKPAAKPKPKKDEEEVSPLLGDTVNTLSNPASFSGFGRARGTVFLVDARSRRVIWSAFQPTRDSSAQEMDRTAREIVNRFKSDLKKK